MTVPTDENRADYVGNGTATNYPYDFKIFNDTDLEVYIVSGGVETQLTLGTDYTVNGAGEEGGGEVVFTTAPADGDEITIVRVIPVVQETDIRNQGRYYPEVVEDTFDRSRMIDQQLAEQVGRSLKHPVFGGPWDALGKEIVNVGDPTTEDSATNRGWVEELIAGIVGGDAGSEPITFTFTGDGVTTDYLLEGATLSGSEFYYVFLDGVSQQPITDFTIASVTNSDATLRFIEAPPYGAKIVIRSFNIGIIEDNDFVRKGQVGDEPVTTESGTQSVDSALNSRVRKGQVGSESVSDANGASRSVSEWIDGIAYTFNTLQEAKNATWLREGMIIRWVGYYNIFGGGGNIAEIVPGGSFTPNGGSFIDLPGSGTQARSIFPNGVSPLQFGARADGTDDHPYIQATIDYSFRASNDEIRVIDLESKKYSIGSPLVYSNEGINASNISLINGTFTALDSGNWTDTNSMLEIDIGSQHHFHNISVEGEKVANCVDVSSGRFSWHNGWIFRWRDSTDGWGFRSRSGFGGPKLVSVWSHSNWGEGPFLERPGYAFWIESGDGRFTDCTGAHAKYALRADGPNNMYSNCHFFNGSGTLDGSVVRIDPVAVRVSGAKNLFDGCYFDNGYVDIPQTTSVRVECQLVGCHHVANQSSDLTDNCYIRLISDGVSGKRLDDFKLIGPRLNDYPTPGYRMVGLFTENGGTWDINTNLDALLSNSDDIEFVNFRRTIYGAGSSGAARPLRLISNSDECSLEFVGLSSSDYTRIGVDGDNAVIRSPGLVDASSTVSVRIPTYTLASLPPAAPDGQVVRVSDGSGDRKMVISDGSNWWYVDGQLV